jgi:hypothetical protein
VDAGCLTIHLVVIDLVNGRSPSDTFERCLRVNVVLSLLRMVISVLDLVVVVEKCPRLNVVLSLLRMVISVLDVVVVGNRSPRSLRLLG